MRNRTTGQGDGRLGQGLWRGLAATAALLIGFTAPAPALAQTLTVATAASLNEAMHQVARDFETKHAGVEVKLVVGASGALLERIAQGLPADVLASADAETATLGVQRRVLLSDLRSVFATNTLVLVVPSSLSLPVRSLSDLARPEVVRIAMGRESEVPAGRYAREAINAARLWPSVQRKIVHADDVRQVLDLVASAEVEAGFVYVTDVPYAQNRVRVVQTLQTSTPIRYPANVAAASTQVPLARTFVAFLRSGEARAVFERLGFGLP